MSVHDASYNCEVCEKPLSAYRCYECKNTFCGKHINIQHVQYFYDEATDSYEDLERFISESEQAPSVKLFSPSLKLCSPCLEKMKLDRRL